jgi:hypothetical protein
MQVNPTARDVTYRKQLENIWQRTYRLTLELGMPACLAGPVIMVICDLLSISLTPSFNPLVKTVSEYALGPFGWLEKIGILSIAVSFLILGANFWDSASKMKSRINATAGTLFFMVAIGFLIIDIFNVDITANISSLHGFIHISAAIAVAIIFPISCLLLSFSLASHKLKALAGYTAFTGVVGLAAAIWIAFPSNQAGWIGLSERLLAGLNLIWMVFAGSRTLRAFKGT